MSEEDKEKRRSTISYDVGSLFKIIKNQDANKGDMLAANQKTLFDLKREISVCSKKNYQGEKDIQNLDNKIALLIKNRISLEEVLSSSGGMKGLMLTKTTTLKDKKQREVYGNLFHFLQRETTYTSALARLVKLGEVDNLLQTVMFTLYGNQYDDEEEHLLLSMFKAVLKEDFDEATSLATLMRANTAITRMMTTYTRRGPGQQYLKSTLTSVLQEVTADPNMNLEINPIKVYEAYIIDYETKSGTPLDWPRKVNTPEEAEKKKRNHRSN